MYCLSARLIILLAPIIRCLCLCEYFLLFTPPQFEGGELETEAEVVENRGAKRKPAGIKKIRHDVPVPA